MQVSVLRSVLDSNDLIAKENRKEFDAHGCFVINLMSAPGSGKTAILERTLRVLDGKLRAAVIEGDVLGTLDADRLVPFGVPVVQINTDPHFGGECHLDARMIRNALAALPLDGVDVVFIENVGNLVCPAEFSVGEDRKVMVLSVAEGEDKPLKYPKMFRMARYAVLNKVDLLPHLDFEVDKAMACAREVNPELRFFLTSARTGEGLDTWFDFLRQQVRSPASL